HLPQGRDLLAPPPLRHRFSFFHSRRLRPASLPRPWRGAGAVPRSPVAAPRFSPTAFPAPLRRHPTLRPRRTSLSPPAAAPPAPRAPPRFPPPAFPAPVRRLPPFRPRRTSLPAPGAALPSPGCWTAFHSQTLDASRRPARNNDAAPRPRRSAREAAETTVECRGHCARIVVSAFHRCVE